jgi:hypothetical protein
MMASMAIVVNTVTPSRGLQGVDMEIRVQYCSPSFHGAGECFVCLRKRLTEVIRPPVIYSGLNAYT